MPSIRDFALELAKFAKNQGNNVALLTNGTLVDEKNAEEVAGVFNLIKISLDSTTAEVHEVQRGKGTFSVVTKTIILLKKYNANLELASTVTSKSIKEVPLLAKEYGSMVKFAPFFPNVGRGNENTEFAVTGIEYYDALCSNECINPLGKNSFQLNKIRGHRSYRCAMGNEQISIGSDGSVYPCHLLHTKDFFAGNIRDLPIEEI